MVLRPGVPAGRRHQARDPHAPSAGRARAARRVRRRPAQQDRDRDRRARHRQLRVRGRRHRTPASIHVPVDIELEFADGSTQRVHWDDRGDGNWQRFVVERSSPLVEVWLDPDDKIALDDRRSTHHYRLDGDGAASLRAAAWFARVDADPHADRGAVMATAARPRRPARRRPARGRRATPARCSRCSSCRARRARRACSRSRSCSRRRSRTCRCSTRRSTAISSR